MGLFIKGGKEMKILLIFILSILCYITLKRDLYPISYFLGLGILLILATIPIV
jgi:hypothetical protein